ncbi:MAG TPA: HDOD domain-containing protein [Pseudomonadales bacterium]
MKPRLTISPVKIGTLRRVTAGHPFFAGWDVDRLKTVDGFCQLVEAPAASVVLERDAMDPFTYLLLSGEVTLEDAAGQRRLVRAGELDAGFPIAHLRPSRYRVTAASGTRLIRIEGSRLRRVQARRGSARFVVSESSVGGSWRCHPLQLALTRRLRNGDLPIPTMPGIASRIRRALVRENSQMSEIAAIIGADPGIAGRLIRIANSAAFAGRSPCETLQAALVRLGVERAHNLVLAISTRELFNTGSAFLKERMLAAWRRAIDLAALAAVLARLTPGLDGDRGLLVGLLHEVGALPILRLAEDFPDLEREPAVLDEILGAMTPETSVRVLEQWGMPDAFRDAALNRGNWFRDHDGGPDYTDVLVVAHLHRLVRERTFHRLPRIDETPAFGRLAVGLLSPQLSLLVLDEARSQIQELRSLLS